MDRATLLDGFASLADFGRKARAARRRAFGDEVRIRPAEPLPGRDHARVRAGRYRRLPPLPSLPVFDEGDLWVLPCGPDERGRRAYAEALLAVAARDHLPPFAVAPVPAEEAGACVLWAVAAARLALPDPVEVVARYDLLGSHVAQTALSFGAGVLSGPVEATRTLPLAGTYRPTEHSRPALEALIRAAGRTPRFEEASP